MDNFLERLNNVVANLLNTKYPNVFKVRDLCYHGSKEDLISLVTDLLHDGGYTTVRTIIGVTATENAVYFGIPEIGSWNVLWADPQSCHLYWSEYRELTSIQEMNIELKKILTQSSCK